MRVMLGAAPQFIRLNTMKLGTPISSAVWVVISVAFFALGSVVYKLVPPRSFHSPESIQYGGAVPNAESAIKIAVATWTPLYGERTIQAERPYTAKLEGDVWIVEGTFHSFGLPAAGGVARAEISKADGRIIKVIHGL